MRYCPVSVILGKPSLAHGVSELSPKVVGFGECGVKVSHQISPSVDVTLLSVPRNSLVPVSRGVVAFVIGKIFYFNLRPLDLNP